MQMLLMLSLLMMFHNFFVTALAELMLVAIPLGILYGIFF